MIVVYDYSLEESLSIWEFNAEHWDNYMGDESNDFHRNVVRPKVTELLDINKDDFILDVSCGNGNYSAFMTERGARVVAFDYSAKMIELAKKRRANFLDKIEFIVADATDEQQLMALQRNSQYTKAVCNMAIMDIIEIDTLFNCVNKLIVDDGIFVFSTQHPCFVTLTDKYLTSHAYYDTAIPNQPKEQCYYHRSFQDIFNTCFKHGFTIDGFYEEAYGEKETPDIIIVRSKKIRSIV